MVKKQISLFLFCMFNLLLNADEVYFKLGNQHAALPFSRFAGLLYKDFNMSYEIGKRFDLKEMEKYNWFQTANIGYFNQ